MKKAYSFIMPIGFIGIKSSSEPVPFEMESPLGVTVMSDKEPDILPLEESGALSYTFIEPSVFVGLTPGFNTFGLETPLGITVFCEKEPVIDEVPEDTAAPMPEEEPKLQKIDNPVESGAEFESPAQAVNPESDALTMTELSDFGFTPNHLTELYDELNQFIKEHDSNTLFDSVCDGVHEVLICRPVDCLLYAAACLADDDLDAREYKSLGYCSYPGSNNVYDVSWFEEELTEKLSNIYNLDDVLDVTVEWINYNFYDFERLVELMHTLHISPDGVWQWAQKQ